MKKSTLVTNFTNLQIELCVEERVCSQIMETFAHLGTSAQ